MGDSSQTIYPQAAVSASTPANPVDELRELRRLLLGGDLEEVLNPPLRPEAVSRVLPEAILQASYQQSQLTSAVLPTVEAAIQASVQQDSNILSELLFPVMGPATRKSITAAIGNLLQSLNQTLDHSLSPQSWKWRLEARRTGKTFAEVVLLRTLVYQVEQVLWIHKESGLVLQHVMADTATAQDPDLVSAMLTAIQDFVRDSFVVEAGGSLDTLELGDFSLWLDEGPHAVLACVIRGQAPQELRGTLRIAQEKLHLIYRQALQAFNGDQSVFEGSQTYLADCFRSRFKTRSEEAPASSTVEIQRAARQAKVRQTVALLLAGCIALGLGTWSFLSSQAHQRWDTYVADLNQRPGLVVISHYQRGGHYWLSGLRDPLAADPAACLQATDIDPQQVEMVWEPYLSLAPEFVEQRANEWLDPPATVSLRVDANRVLHLSGVAPEQWIGSVQQWRSQLYGLAGWEREQLISTEQVALDRLRSGISSRQIDFSADSAKITRLQRAELAEVASDIKALRRQADDLGVAVQITIRGRGDAHSGTAYSWWLGQRRAAAITQFWQQQGVSGVGIETQGGVSSQVQGDRNLAAIATFQLDLQPS